MKELNFIGIGGATNVELGGNCSYLKEKDNLLIIDICEEATKKLVDLDAFKDINNIYIVITHTHYDHIAGLGVLIWYCNFILKITPKIIYGTFKYAFSIKKILKLTGVSSKYVKFIKDKYFKINDLKLKYLKTDHTSKLDCFGIMFKDDDGEYYYTGDTKDISFIKSLCDNPSIKTIYTEVAEESYDAHLKYDDLVKLNCDKLVLMHFGTLELYNKAKREGFKTANLVGKGVVK